MSPVEPDDGSAFVLVNSRDGTEYRFSGSSALEECSLVSVKWSSPAYALQGVTVGDPPDDLAIILGAYGFSQSGFDGGHLFRLGETSIYVGISDGVISYFRISAVLS